LAVFVGAVVVVVVAMVAVVVLVALGAGMLWLFGCVCVSQT
jgi:hypothetical protein